MDKKKKTIDCEAFSWWFRYSARKFKLANISWHERDGFYILDDSIYDEMPFLNSLQRQFGAAIIFYYSIKHKRIDIRFKKDGLPFLMITFERGYPETDETKEIEIWERKNSWNWNLALLCLIVDFWRKILLSVFETC